MYYKIIEVPEKPYLAVFKVAETEAQYNELPDKVDVFEDPVLTYGFNICLQMLENGAIIPRTPSVVAQAQAEYEMAQRASAVRKNMQELRDKDAEISLLTRLGEDTATAISEFGQLKTERGGLLQNPM